MTYLPNSKKITADFSMPKLKMAEWLVMDFNEHSDHSLWILKGLLSSCFDKRWYLWRWKRDGNEYSLYTSSRSNGRDDTKQGQQDISQSKNQRERKIVFPFYFTLENINCVCRFFFDIILFFFDIVRMPQNVALKTYESHSKECLKCFFSPNLYGKWIVKCLGRYVLLILS